jgi:hypothetical protein
MMTLSMNKSTKVISLVLMGSALALAGCSTRSDDDEDERTAQGGQGYRAGVPVMIPRSGSGVGRGAVSTAPSARGGFGGTGAVSSGS